MVVHVRLMAALVLVGCGRIGFDAPGTSFDAANDAMNDAQPVTQPIGRADPTFGTNGQATVGTGSVEHGEDVVPRAGGGYFVAGFRQAAGITKFQMIAFTQAGALDTGFGQNGFANPSLGNDDYGYGLVPQADGSLVFLGDGDIGGFDDIIVSRVDAAGTVIPSYGMGGFRTVSAGAGTQDTSRRGVQIADTTYVCGSIRYDQNNSEIALVALDKLGDPDPVFDGDGVVFDPVQPQNNYCFDLIADRSGRLVIAGEAGTTALVARYGTNGQRDAAFGPAGYVAIVPSGSLAGLALAPNDDIVAAGETGSDGVIVRVTAGGAPAAFGTSGVVTIANTPLTDVVVQADGKIVVAGMRHIGGGRTDFAVLRRNADGTPDPTFGTGGELLLDGSDNDRTRALIQDPEGKLILVGYVSIGTAERPFIARIE